MSTPRSWHTPHPRCGTVGEALATGSPVGHPSATIAAAAAYAMCALPTLPSMSDSPDTSPSAGPPTAGVLDAQALARLQELDPGGKSGLLARVLATYLRSLDSLLEQLRIARQDADLQGQRHVVHTLKSSSASVGALKLSEQCADIERRLREGLPESLDGLFDDLKTEGERVLAALRQP